MLEKRVPVDDIFIQSQAFGTPTGIPLLLIMGATGPGVYWHRRIIDRFVDAGYFVIRYDNRDTGRSTCRPFEDGPYNLHDMALDALAVLDAHGIEKAHVLGTSMGGMIAQSLAIEYPERIRSISLLATTPLAGGGDAHLLGAEDLPTTDPEVFAEMMAVATQPVKSQDEEIEKRISLYRLLATDLTPQDADELREVFRIELDQSNDVDMGMNHAQAVAASSPVDRRNLLRQLSVPALVFHGTDDPMFHLSHAESLANTIPGARLIKLEGCGHYVTSSYYDTIIPEMISAHKAADNGPR